jgi:hypothetical protein
MLSGVFSVVRGHTCVGFKFVTLLSVKITVFQNVMMCSLVDHYHCLVNSFAFISGPEDGGNIFLKNG